MTSERGLESQLLLARARERMLGRAQPTTVGRYRILEKLGSGGMGVVYAALDDELSRRVAIKILRGDLSESASGRHRLIREAQAMAQLSHPNVAHVYEVGHHGDQVFVAMELVEGMTLRRWSKIAKRTPGEILRMHIQAGEGLAAAHDAGIIHRDYKMDNVLVGPNGRPRVLDFGLARPECEAATLTDLEVVPEHPTDSGSLTVTGAVMGTPAYMAPEQLEARPVDARADQYAFCASLFEALYGDRPFAGSTVTQLITSTNKGETIYVDPRRARVPRRVHAALLRGLKANAADRFDTMADLLDALRAPLHAASVRRSVRLWGLGAGVMAVAVAAGGLALAGPDEAPSSDAPPALSAEDERRAQILDASALPAERAQPLANDPAEVTVHRLDNGLTVFIAPKIGEPHIEARLAIRADYTDDAEDRPGIAALTTSVLSSGSRRLGTLDFELERPHLDRQVELLGQLAHTDDPAARAELIAQADAAYRGSSDVVVYDELSRVSAELGFPDGWTEANDTSVFSSKVPHNRLGVWAELLAEPMIDPVFRGFVATAAAELEFAREAAEQSVPFTAAREALAPYDGIHGNWHRAFDHFRTVPYQDVVDFHDAYYRPNNAAIILVGDVTAVEVLPMLERAFGTWEPAPVPEKVSVAKPLPAEPIVVDVTDARPTSSLIAFPIPPARDGERHKIEALADAFAGDGLLGSLLVPGGDITWTDVYVGARELHTLAVAAPGVEPETIEEQVLSALADITEDRVPEAAWQAAIARQQLEATRWATSPTTLADRIAWAYSAGRAWSDVVAGMQHKATQESLASTARDLLEGGAVAVRVRSGEPPRIAEPALPAARHPKAPGGSHSALATRLLTRPAADLEPQFLAEGRDYRTYQYGAGRVVLVPDDSPVFRLTWSWPIGVDQEPLSCDAIRAKVSARHDWPGLQGLELDSICASNFTALTVLGTDSSFEDVWPSLRAFIDDTRIPLGTAAVHLRETLARREEARQNPIEKMEALHVLAVRGEHRIDAHLPPDEDIPFINPRRLSAALARVTASDPDLSYVGPRGDLFAQGLPPATGNGAPRQPLRFAKLNKTTVFVLNDRGRQDVQIRLSVRVPDVPQATVLAELFEHFTGAAPELMNEIAGLSVEPLGATRFTGIRRVAHQLEVQAPLPDAARGIELGLALLRRPRDAEAFAQARKRAESAYRGARSAPRMLPEAMQLWQDADVHGDPKFANWLALASLEFDTFDRYAAAVADAPVAIAILADLSEVDASTFARFGDVVEVAPEELLRDPGLADLDVLGAESSCECTEAH